MKSRNQLNAIREQFQSKINNPKLTCTYIAPKDELEYGKFMELVEDTYSSSRFAVLSNEDFLNEKIAIKFSNDVELEIYVALNDIASSLGLYGVTLAYYIEHNKIDFDLDTLLDI